MSSNPIDVFTMSETWLDESVCLNLAIDGYSLERRDRDCQGGGIGCYIKSSICYSRRRDLECNDIEIMWVEIRIPNARSWLIGIVYRAPSSHVDFFSKLERNLENVYSETHNIVLTGDLNCSPDYTFTCNLKNICICL